MKYGPVLLLNLLVMVAALLVYDHLRDEPKPERTRARAGSDAGLEERVRALEVARREPLPDPAPVPVTVPADRAVPSGEAPQAAAEAVAAKKTPGPITPAEIRRFRDVSAAVQRADRIEKNRKRVDDALDKLPFRLTKRQRDRIHTAVADFEPRIDEIWIEAKTEARRRVEAGGKVDRQQIVTTVGEIIQKAFAETITDVVDRPADAEVVAQTLMPGGKW